MSFPSTPTWTTTISAAMIAAGRLNVSYTQVSEMAARGAQDIKTELWDASRYDYILASETLVLVTTGNSVFTLPPNFDSAYSLRVYDGVRGRAQAGGADAVTLASADTTADEGYAGWYVFTLANTGSGQYRQIDRYTESTKIASVTNAWTAPGATTDYLIGQRWWPIQRDDDATAFSSRWGRPTSYRITGNSLTVWPPPDHVYPILMVYGPNLTRLDETETIFIKWLRERVALVKQGIKVQTMFLFDDDRYEQQLAIWETMKARYAMANNQSDTTTGSR